MVNGESNKIITFVGERGSGTLDRMLATPIKESEIIGGYAIVFLLLAIFLLKKRRN